MKPLLLAICMGLCTVSAIAQPYGGNYTLPSRTYQLGAGDDVVSFATPILLDPMSPSYPNFGNITYAFFIDTNFVDMEFTKAGGTFHVSHAINSSSATYPLSNNGYVKGAMETAGYGGPVGTITRQGPAGTTLFGMFIGLAVGTSMGFVSPLPNLIVNADGTFLRFIVHPQAIATLPGRTYQIGLDTQKSIIRCGTSASGTGNGPLVLLGGSFAVVPEPTTLIPIGGALMLAWNARRLRKAGYR